MLAENVNRALSGFQEGQFGLQNYCESSASSFEELYEISPTFRMLVDDSEPRLEISTEPVPEAEANPLCRTRIHHLIARLIAP